MGYRSINHMPPPSGWRFVLLSPVAPGAMNIQALAAWGRISRELFYHKCFSFRPHPCYC